MNELIVNAGSIWSSLPSALRAVVLLCGGWVAANLLKHAMTAFLTLVRFDRMGEKTGFSEFLRKGNTRYTPSRLVGVLVYWITLLAAFMEILRILDPEVHSAFSAQIAKALPDLAAAALIVVVGCLLASFLSNFILTIALNSSMPNARLWAKVVRYLSVAIVVTLGLEQAGLGRSIVEFIFQILFGAVSFGAALAFGLGCKDLARDSMQRFISNLRERERDRQGTDLEG